MEKYGLDPDYPKNVGFIKFEKPYLFELNHIDTDFDIISGISNGEIYGIDYSTYYSVYYADTESPDGSRSFTSDLAGIFYLKEQNDKKYIYGYILSSINGIYHNFFIAPNII